MTALEAQIKARIRHDGPLPVSEYMTRCLDHYYRRAPAVGAAGDFITAPEISQIFGELLGLWAAIAWENLRRPRPIRLVELGPGRGTLMADALRAIAQTAPDFREAVDLHLVEVNATLHAQQREALASASPTWHDEIASVPPGPIIVLANEFLDALPVHQFVRTAEGWRERCVDLVDEQLAFVAGPVITDPPIEPAQAKAPTGAIVEAGLAARIAVGQIARRICDQNGAALFIDYGPLASGHGDTLQAVSRHRKTDPLVAPGESDLTAHVDFAALARTARAAGADVYGPVPQGVFLHRLGYAARAATLLRRASPRQAGDIEAASERLIGDAGMGTLFKALSILRHGAAAPPGFDPHADRFP